MAAGPWGQCDTFRGWGWEKVRTDPKAPPSLTRYRRSLKFARKFVLISSPAPGNLFIHVSGRSVAWLARLFRVQEVVSSNLTAPTIFYLN